MEFVAPMRVGKSEIIVKKSRFIGQAAPVFSEEEALEFIASVRQAHPGATHCVYAYSVGLGDFAEKASDDGEPKGTAGYPVLEVIKKRDLQNVVCTVTRYFGGTKLGAGGLIRAYTNAASLALDDAGLGLYRYHDLIRITVDYSIFEKVERLVKAYNCVIKDISYAEKVALEAFAVPETIPTLQSHISDLTSGDVHFQVSPGTYVRTREAD